MDRLADWLQTMEQLRCELAKQGMLAQYPGSESDMGVWGRIVLCKISRHLEYLEAILADGIKALGEGRGANHKTFQPFLQGKNVEESHRLFWSAAMESSIEFQRRKTIEISNFLAAIDSEVAKQDEVLELCGGTGDIGLLMAARGHRALSLDLDSSQVRFGDQFSKSVLRDKSYLHLVNIGNVLTDARVESSDAALWVAIHPCALGKAMPDEIITRWLANTKAEKLVIMTCCQRKAKHAFPAHLAQFVAPDSWASLCQESAHSSHGDEEVCANAQIAMDAIDGARINFIESQGSQAELRHTQGTFKGNIIVARKN